MDTPIRILLAEDSPTDAELAEREIRKALPHVTLERVETRDKFLAALETYQPDLVISDYNMPSFDGMTALKLSLEQDPFRPVIIWTGSLNEDVAVECMKAGATNYVIKENIKRLGTAVVRALEEKQIRLDRKHAEEALIEKEERYRTLFDLSPSGIVLLDLDGNIVAVNESFCQFLGYTPDELIGRSVHMLAAPEHLPSVDNDITLLQQTGKRYEHVVKDQHKDGSIRLMELRESLIALPDGRQGIVVVANDITERERAEEALREAEAKYRSLVERLPMVIYTAELGINGAWTYVSPQLEKLLGFTPQEWMENPGLWYQQTHPDDRNRQQTLEEKTYAQGQPFISEYRIFTRDKQQIWVRDSGHVLAPQKSGDTPIVQGVLADITERKRAEEAFLMSEMRLQQAIRASNIGIFEHDHLIDDIYWSPEQRKNYGWNAEEPVTLQKYFSHIHPEDVERIMEDVRHAHDPAGDGLFDVEHRIIHRDGSIRWLNTRSQTFFEGTENERRPRRTIGAVVDITERKLTEEVIRKAEVQYRSLVEQSPAVIYMDKADKFSDSIYISPQIETLLGYSPADFEKDKRLWLKLLHPEDYQYATQSIDSAIENGYALIEYRLMHRTGQTIWVRDTAIPIRDQNGNVEFIQGFMEDITARKEAEIQLQQTSQILETIFEHTHLLFAYMDADFNFIRVNRAYANADEKSPEYFPGKNHFELYPSTENETIFRHVIEKGEWYAIYAKPFEYELSKERGISYWDWVLMPIKDTQNKVIGIILTLQNVTERVKGEEAAFKHAIELAAVAEISIAASTILDTDVLLQKTVDLAKERLKLYHAQIYLLNNTKDLLLLTAGAGEIGRAMMSKKHEIAVTHQPSIVAHAARTRQSVVINNIKQSPDFLSNPLLPDTRSEMAVPLIFGDQLLGILDIQSEHSNHFSEEDANIQTTLAAQIANAIQNARQYQQIRATAANLTGIQGAINTGAIVSITNINGEIEFVNDNFVEISKYSRAELTGKNHRIIKSGLHSQAFFQNMWETISSGKTWRNEICNRAKDGSLHWVDTTIAPILDEHGEPVKYISVRFDITERKKAEDGLLAKTKELESLFAISSQLRAAHNSEEILPIVLDEIHRILNADAGAILLLDEEGKNLTYKYGTGSLALNNTRQINLNKSISGHVLKTRLSYVTETLSTDPKRAPEMLGADNLGPAVFVPLQSEAEVLGILMASRTNQPSSRAFSPASVQLLSAIGEMVGNALRRTHLYDDALRRLEQMRALLNIDIAIASSLDPDQILHVLLIETLSQLKVDAADVLLINPDTRKLEYRSGRGFRSKAIESTSLLIGEGYAGLAALESRTVVIQDVPQQNFVRKALIAEEDFKSYICTPLITKGEVIGVLEIFGRTPFSATDESMSYLTTLATRAAISIENSKLFNTLKLTNSELIHAYDATIEGWSRALDLREHETERHTARVMDMTIKLAKTMEVPEHEIVHIRRGALLHDIGKMGIPDSILLKPSGLTDEEWESMRKHPQYAYEMLLPIQYLAPALDIPYCHHERWDGTGYPRGLKGEEIPLAARIFAVCDVWDAVTNDRPYRDAWSKKETLKFIREQTGKHFDPKVVRAFQKMIKNNK